MPILTQGNIFDAVATTDLVVVFGHRGYSASSSSWKEFASTIPALNGVTDPFVRFNNGPVNVNGRWLWFVDTEGYPNRGMSDEQLYPLLDKIFAWAKDNEIKSIATNGIKDARQAGRRTNAERAAGLVDYAARQEKELGVEVELISLDDEFVRQTLPD